MSSINNYYNKNLKSFARKHRNESTKAEIKLWTELLSKKKMLGYPFLRQRPIDSFIADFFCKSVNLIIETDGYTHQLTEVIEKDRKKEKRLNELGYYVLRFQDEEVLNDIENVRLEIENTIKNLEVNGHPPLSPFKGGNQS
jgi:very-short-patch-repair endonuclease